MSLHYQVNTEYVLIHGKPYIKCISINSTKSACTTMPIHPDFSFLKTYRILHTLQEAKNYIEYLQGIYKMHPAPLPVLDSGQKELFKEGTK